MIRRFEELDCWKKAGKRFSEADFYAVYYTLALTFMQFHAK